MMKKKLFCLSLSDAGSVGRALEDQARGSALSRQVFRLTTRYLK